MATWKAIALEIQHGPERGQWRVITFDADAAGVVIHPDFPDETWPTKAEADARVADITAAVSESAS